MNIKELLKQLKGKMAENDERANKIAVEMRGLLENNDLEKARGLRQKLDELDAQAKEDAETVKDYERALEGTKEQRTGNKNPNGNEKTDERAAINAYIRSKGTITDGVEIRDHAAIIPANLLRDAVDGVTTTTDTVDKIIPKDISYVAQRELETVVDLKPFTNVFKATTASGTYPILKNVTQTLPTVAELEKNPALSKPEFYNIDWKVETHRGAIPISQEAIDDTAMDLLAIVDENAQRQRLNTTNQVIADVFKTFTAKSVETIDDLKTLNNVELDPAYQRALVVTQSFYNWLDLEKDGNGRYLLQDSVISPSGKMILGIPVVVINDESLGEKGEAHAFLGDLRRAVIFADRVDMTVRWADNDIYGQYLQVATRFGAYKADDKAGYFLTKAPKA